MSDPFENLPPDPVIEYYKKDLDMTLIRESLKPEERRPQPEGASTLG